MEATYRLEFNEEQQGFHLDNGTHEPNTYGWFTIFEQCTDFEFYLYESYVNRIPKKRLTKKYLLKSAVEVERLMSNLREYGVSINWA